MVESIGHREFLISTLDAPAKNQSETIVPSNISQPIYGVIPAGFDFFDACILAMYRVFLSFIDSIAVT